MAFLQAVLDHLGSVLFFAILAYSALSLLSRMAISREKRAWTGCGRETRLNETELAIRRMRRERGALFDAEQQAADEWRAKHQSCD